MVTGVVGTAMMCAVILAFATGCLPIGTTAFFVLVWVIGLGTIGTQWWKWKKYRARYPQG